VISLATRRRLWFAANFIASLRRPTVMLDDAHKRCHLPFNAGIETTAATVSGRPMRRCACIVASGESAFPKTIVSASGLGADHSYLVEGRDSVRITRGAIYPNRQRVLLN
jgi:hypothetical protein